MHRAYRTSGAYRARTCDPLLVRQMLSQLSYTPIFLSVAICNIDIILQFISFVKHFFYFFENFFIFFCVFMISPVYNPIA